MSFNIFADQRQEGFKFEKERLGRESHSELVYLSIVFIDIRRRTHSRFYKNRNKLKPKERRHGLFWTGSWLESSRLMALRLSAQRGCIAKGCLTEYNGT